jgi:hypothetical protein
MRPEPLRWVAHCLIQELRFQGVLAGEHRLVSHPPLLQSVRKEYIRAHVRFLHLIILGTNGAFAAVAAATARLRYKQSAPPDGGDAIGAPQKSAIIFCCHIWTWEPF